jgi:hypothetical protein
MEKQLSHIDYVEKLHYLERSVKSLKDVQGYESCPHCRSKLDRSHMQLMLKQTILDLEAFKPIFEDHMKIYRVELDRLDLQRKSDQKQLNLLITQRKSIILPKLKKAIKNYENTSQINKPDLSLDDQNVWNALLTDLDNEHDYDMSLMQDLQYPQ